MLVKAIKLGYIGNRRIKEGEVFELKDILVTEVDPKTGKQKPEKKKITAESQFSEFWMEKLEAEEVKKASSKKIIKPDLNDNEEVI